MGDAMCEAHQGCGDSSEVSLCTITGGGHQWPGGNPFPGGGNTSTDLIATDAIWTFFVAHPMVR
jgi:polyhydroxybutyrate depolymerase